MYKTNEKTALFLIEWLFYIKLRYWVQFLRTCRPTANNYLIVKWENMGVASSTTQSTNSKSLGRETISTTRSEKNEISSRTTRNLRHGETDIVHIMMPLYYNHVPLTPADTALANQTW